MRSVRIPIEGAALSVSRRRAAAALVAGALVVAGVPSLGRAASAAGGFGLAENPIAVASPGQRGVSLNALVITSTTDGAIATGDTLTLTLASGTWATAPMATGSPTIGAISGTGSRVLTFTALSNSQASAPLTLTGARVDLPFASGPVELDLADGGTGAATFVAAVVATARIAGADRYATAAALFDAGFGQTANLVLTSGTNYPDAMSATYLARQLSTGVLTTDPKVLTPVVAQEIRSHGVQDVYVVGGSVSVSPSVVAQLTAMGISVIRIGGTDRYDTNQKVDVYNTQFNPTVVIATGASFADALAAGPALYATGYPLVLAPSTGLTASIKSTLTTLGATHAIILGGTAAVSAQVESQLTTMGIQVDQRIAGADRTATAAAIAAWETAGIAAASPYRGLNSLGFGIRTIDVLRGDSYADGLAAGAAVGALKHPLLLASSPSVLGPGAPTFLAKRAIFTDTIEAVGGSGAVSDATLAAAVQALR